MSEANVDQLRDDWEITVCDNCLTATCWQGEFYCMASKSAGIKKITIAEARKLGRENPSWWLNDEDVRSKL